MTEAATSVPRYVATSQTPERPPPSSVKGPVAWMRDNLFATWTDTILTLVAFYFIYLLVDGIVNWGLIHAVWSGNDGSACSIKGAGACWPFISAKMGQFMYGSYPEALRWRVNLTYLLAIAGLAPLMIPPVPGKLWAALYLIFIFPVVAVILLAGGVLGLAPVQTSLWGGLMVTLVVASAGIAGAFPLGIILALGRRSQMPAVRLVSVTIIEFVRGVPLITVLFMAAVMLPLFLPGNITIDKLLRALVMVAVFAGAYLAEVIRGGLQAIPKGQFEAGDALGLTYWQAMGLIILPQALKLVIPGVVNTFIALFKDTSLVLIIGIFDLLGAVQSAMTDSKWLSPSTPTTGYFFAGFVFWAFCFAMSRYSLVIERRLAAGGQRSAAK